MTPDLHLKTKSLAELVAMRAVMLGFGYDSIAAEVRREIEARGYELPCSCAEIAGDDPACPIHGRHKEQI